MSQLFFFFFFFFCCLPLHSPSLKMSLAENTHKCLEAKHFDGPIKSTFNKCCKFWCKSLHMLLRRGKKAEGFKFSNVIPWHITLYTCMAVMRRTGKRAKWHDCTLNFFEFSSFSPLTDWVIGETWGMIQQRASSGPKVNNSWILISSHLHQ